MEVEFEFKAHVRFKQTGLRKQIVKALKCEISVAILSSLLRACRNKLAIEFNIEFGQLHYSNDLELRKCADKMK